MGFPGDSDGEPSAWNVGNLGSTPRLGRFLGEGNGNPLQYSCLENSMGGGAWWGIVHGVAKSWTWLSDWATSLHFRYKLKICVLFPLHLSTFMYFCLKTYIN